MHVATGAPLLHAHREMLMDGLKRVFGDFDDTMLERVLPMLEWVQIGGGEALLEQGSQDESLYFVISGRLRAVATAADGTRTVLGEVARGETVGEMAFFTREPRTATVVAVRESVLVRFSRDAFREVLLAYPLVSLNMSRLVIERLKRASVGTAVARPVAIGIAAISADAHALGVASMLQEVLAPAGRCVVIDSAWIDQRLGAGSACVPTTDAAASRRIAHLLEQVESEHEFVLFVADAAATGWTRRCLRHCDEVILVADADAPVERHPIERECLPQGDSGRGEIQQTLLLLHDDAKLSPCGTGRWLAGRTIARHLHVRRGRLKDWQRVGRILSGTAVGLVLSGGGARGFAHLGVLCALEEQGIEVDMVGGTSIGAVMGAFAAMDLPSADVVQRARSAFRSNPTRDFNPVPLLSLIGGARLKHVIDQAVAESCGRDAGIEDLWKPFFCVSSNYSAAREAVHVRGPLARSIRASVSIPGALPPVILGGELHIDGGTFNNFPADVMRRMGAARIVGVNLLRDRNVRYELEEIPGPFSLLRDKLLGRRHRLPSITSLLLNASMMNSYARQKEVQALVDLYFAPDVHRYGMLEWGAFDKVVQAGYAHAQQVLAEAPPAQLASFPSGRRPAEARPLPRAQVSPPANDAGPLAHAA
ncbi:patatin-like phospholipase family protein [Ramlibacter pallidus]|uniref:Patatin-like phospholipase family protein n=1 Tax=Ramlibacter pallidus TaxID=2780087 RepID=A0ABR9S6A6_9BURK|nr:patatin-like phospholipase family protein [Ramlibacter pallidus]MBE7369054.1 patatin-like phospholipase family protein [Ramlibacter pallidus]